MTPPPPMPTLEMRKYGGLYLGLGGGYSMPLSYFKNNYNNGYNGYVSLGVDPISSPLGLRVDVGFNHFGGPGNLGSPADDAKLYSANIDAKLRLPPNSEARRVYFYALGGVGAHRFTNYGDSRLVGLSNPPTAPGTLQAYGDSFSNSRTLFGWNAGGGIAFGYKAAELFAEARYFDINTTYELLGNRTRLVPITFGVNIY